MSLAHSGTLILLTTLHVITAPVHTKIFMFRRPTRFVESGDELSYEEFEEPMSCSRGTKRRKEKPAAPLPVIEVPSSAPLPVIEVPSPEQGPTQKATSNEVSAGMESHHVSVFA